MTSENRAVEDHRSSIVNGKDRMSLAFMDTVNGKDTKFLAFSVVEKE
jgi:hypothetical protein